MYPTDLTETQWQFIKRTLQFDERKRKNSLRSIWNAINFLLKTGCQWRMLPLSFAKWQLVYYYYKKWADQSLFDLLLEKLRERVRVKQGQNGEASLGILDSQSVRWGNNRSLNSFDGNKKVKGIKLDELKSHWGVSIQNGGRVDKGISAQVSHRTVRKRLRLHGSSKSATPYHG